MKERKNILSVLLLLLLLLLCAYRGFLFFITFLLLLLPTNAHVCAFVGKIIHFLFLFLFESRPISKK
jgi:hypothetical protein